MTTPLTLKEGSSLAVPFLIGVGACYSFGYWGYFNIDLLQFVGLADVAKLAIYPLLFLALSTAINIAWSELAVREVLPLGGGRDTPIGQFGLKHWRALVLAHILLLVVTLLFAREPAKWYLVCFFVASFSTPLTHATWMIALLPDPRLRAIVLLQVLLLPSLSFAYGRSVAIAVAGGDAPLYVDAQRSGLTLQSDLAAPLVYLGKLGETYVYLETKTSRLALVKIKDDQPLILRRRGG